MKDLLVLGAGMQGVAAAYDSAAYGPFERIVVADADIMKAIDACDRVNGLLGDETCEPVRIDASSPAALRQLFGEFKLAIAALPYQMHPQVETLAIELGVSVVDMGEDTDDALRIHGMDPQAKATGSAIVTDCGLAPGLINVLARRALESCPGATHVRAYCGGLPESPFGPLGYVLRFSMDSVVGEYSEEVVALRDGEVVVAQPLEGIETIQFDGLGELEAFTTSGGSGTAPHAFRGKVANFEYKTLRYPGHVAAMKLFRDCGFWTEETLPAIGVSPRRAFAAVLESTLSRPEIPDVVALRVEAEGPAKTVRFELLERQDPATGFTAMERLTGFSTSIVALQFANGGIEPGCRACEEAVRPEVFMSELARREITVRTPAIA